MILLEMKNLCRYGVEYIIVVEIFFVYCDKNKVLNVYYSFFVLLIILFVVLLMIVLGIDLVCYFCG